MTTDPTAREIAFRLLAAHHGGSKKMAVEDDMLVPVIGELVEIANAGLLIGSRNAGLSYDDALRAIESVMDSLDEASRDDPAS